MVLNLEAFYHEIDTGASGEESIVCYDDEGHEDLPFCRSDLLGLQSRYLENRAEAQVTPQP